MDKVEDGETPSSGLIGKANVGGAGFESGASLMGSVLITGGRGDSPRKVYRSASFSRLSVTSSNKSWSLSNGSVVSFEVEVVGGSVERNLGRRDSRCEFCFYTSRI